MSDAQVAQGTPIADAGTRSVAEATDGKGSATKLIRAGEKPGHGTKPEPTAKPGGEAKPAKQTAGEKVAAAETASQAATPKSLAFDDIEKLLGADFAPAAEDSDDGLDDLDDGDADTEGKPEGRFNKTVRHLRKRAQAAEQQFQTLQLELQKRDQMMSLMQKDLEHQRENQRLWQTQLQQLNQPKNPDEMPLDPNDPEYAVKKFRREVLAEAQQKLAGQFDPYKSELENLKSEIKRRDDEARALRTRAQYNHYADRAAAELTKGFDQDRAGRLNSALGKFILTAAYSWKTDPQTAAAVLDRVMTDYGLGKLKMKMAMNQPAVSNTGIPTPPLTGRSAANPRGTPIPTREEAKAAGFKDELEMMTAQGGMISRS